MLSLPKRDLDGPLEERTRDANDGSRRFNPKRAVGGKAKRRRDVATKTDVARCRGYETSERRVERVRRFGAEGERGKASEIEDESFEE